MCNAYIRYTINGERHSAGGAGVDDCTKIYTALKDQVNAGGDLYSYRLKYLKVGDKVKVELIKRRPSKNLREGFEFEVTHKVKSEIKVKMKKIFNKDGIQSFILAGEPVCKKCKCLYPIEYSKHEDYCDECFKEIQMQPTKQCYGCFEKHSSVYCPKCFSSLHWDLTKGQGRNSAGVYIDPNVPKVSELILKKLGGNLNG
jgi:hypothetical protein